MKKNLLKRIGAVALAVAVSLTMGTAAFAADTIDDQTTVGAAGDSVTFTDTFTISDGDNAQNLPAAAFNYAIAPGTGAAATATSPLIKAGIGSPTITNASHSATAAGTTTNSVDVTADFSGVTFTEAGIYRYDVTETKGSSSVSVDIAIDVDNSNKGTYILDVYVKKNGSDFEPYAYVLSKTGAITQTETEEEIKETYSDKVDTIKNEYTTYDLTVSKTIEGDMAANEFDFTVNVASVPTDAFVQQDSETAVAGSESGNTFTKTLKTGESTVIKGLPSTATYAIQEAVNQLEGYKVEVVDNNTNPGTYNWIGTTDAATAYGNSTAATLGKADVTVAFTNTLNSISPTNVVMRFAPYLFILGAAIVLLVLMRRRRASRDTE